jgi:hypothetical protein
MKQWLPVMPDMMACFLHVPARRGSIAGQFARQTRPDSRIASSSKLPPPRMRQAIVHAFAVGLKAHQTLRPGEERQLWYRARCV